MNFKVSILLFFITISLFGRDNPFRSLEEMEDVPLSNNYVQAPNDFNRTTFKLPDTARIVDSIEIIYQNIDGSIAKKRIAIDNKINWNKELMFSYKTPEKKTRVVRKCPRVKEKKCPKVKTIKETIVKVVNEKFEEINSTIKPPKKMAKNDVIDEITISGKEVINPVNEKVISDKERKVISIGNPRFAFFEFFEDDHRIKINTTDKKKRHFMLVRPNRIVLDFYRDTDFQNQTFDVSKGIFREMKISTEGEKGIYRVTIYIAKGYRYRLNKTEVGYEIKCYKR
jgi:hypothetical protein